MPEREPLGDKIAVVPVHQENGVNFASAQRGHHLAGLHSGAPPRHPVKLAPRDTFLEKGCFREGLQPRKIARHRLSLEIDQRSYRAFRQYSKITVSASSLAADGNHGKPLIAPQKADDRIQAGDLASAGGERSGWSGGSLLMKKSAIETFIAVIAVSNGRGEIGISRTFPWRDREPHSEFSSSDGTALPLPRFPGERTLCPAFRKAGPLTCFVQSRGVHIAHCMCENQSPRLQTVDHCSMMRKPGMV